MDTQERMIMSMIQGFSTYLLYTACELKLFDYLYQEKMNLTALSKETAVEEEMLYRLLRPLVGLRLLQEEKGHFSLTPLGARLAKDAHNSLQGLVLFCGRECMGCWSKMYEAIKLRTLPCLLIEKKPFFEAQQEDDRKFATFNAMMRNSTRNLDLLPYFKEQTSITAVRTIVDIGGGAGDNIARFLGFYPNADGLILDLKHVKNEARNNLHMYNLSERCKFAEGNFFEKINAKADLFILSRILHDWEDSKASKILTNTCHAMSANSTLLVIEKVLPNTLDSDDSVQLYMSDLYIWSMCGGKERTEAEFNRLFSQNGLVLKRKYKLPADEYVLELTKKYEEGMIC